MNLEQMQQALAVVRAEIHQVVIGQEQAVEHALIAILCGQHALLEGVPGVAKTLLARTLAVVMGGSFQRIQFTPDLMPADITGTSIFWQVRARSHSASRRRHNAGRARSSGHSD